MDDRTFDALARRAAPLADRRALFGLLAGAVLASITPLGAAAKSGHKHGHDDGGGGSGHGGGGGGSGHGGGGGNGDKDKIDKKQCKQEYDDARSFWVAFCFRNFDQNRDGVEQPTEYVLSHCLADLVDGCTGLLLKCTKQAQAAHIACVDGYASKWGYL